MLVSLRSEGDAKDRACGNDLCPSHEVCGKQYRRTAGTRSWAEAERVTRDVQGQLTGKVALASTPATKDLRAALEVFVADKWVEALPSDHVRIDPS